MKLLQIILAYWKPILCGTILGTCWIVYGCLKVAARADRQEAEMGRKDKN